MKTLKIIVSGSTGRMGNEIKNLIQSMPQQFALAGEINRQQRAKISSGACDVVVDFSLPELFEQTLKECVAGKVPIVSGTTGLNELQAQALASAGREIPVFWAPNMSLGVAVFRKMIAQFKALKDYDFHIHEVHHNQKKDTPSGTAIILHDSLKAAIGRDTEISSERGGGVYGIHTVRALGPEETLEITHQALNRSVFASGSLKAAQWLVGKPSGLYGMDDLLS